MRKLITIFIALLIVLPVFGLVGVSSVKAAVGDPCGRCLNVTGTTINCDTTTAACATGSPCSAKPTDPCPPDACDATTLKCVAAAGGGGLDVWGGWSEGGAVTEGSLQTATGLGAEDPRETAAQVINVILGFLGIIAVILILVGGFMWMTAAGNEDKVGTAKKLMTAGVVGLIIVLAAFGIAKFVVNALIGATS